MSELACIAGIDPGLRGAVAFYWPHQPTVIEVHDMPIVAGIVDTAGLARILRGHCPSRSVVERASAMPRQGVSSTFKFGVMYGGVLGVLGALEIPQEIVAASKWKRLFSLPADKEAARALAIRYWPSCSEFSREKDHGRAEAALLARYGHLAAES